MKKFFDTLAVFMGNVLRLTPVTWKQAQLDAVVMRQAVADFVPNQVEVNGVMADVEPPQSPFTFLGEATLNALGFVTVVWLISQLVSLFLVLLPFLAAIALGIWIFGSFAKPKGHPVTS